MNRSLRTLALLGLFALGASSAGAQKLFDVTYNPSQLKLVITPTNANPSGLPQGNSVFPVGYEMLFKNFFTVSPTQMVSGTGALSTTSIEGGIKPMTQSDSSASFDAAFDQSSSGRGLSLLGFYDSDMTLNPSSQAFRTDSSLTINFTSAMANYNYMPTAGFSGTVNVFNDASSLSGGYDIGTYSYSVVPEPSTYAAIAGALGLAYAVYRRRRQAAAATA